MTLTEDDLDTLVSIAIRRAEILDELGSSAARDAWNEVMLYEEQLATITPPEEIPGGIARVGAVAAALSAGQRLDAERLASKYLAETLLPAERREAIARAFQDDREFLARRFPALSRIGRLTELDEWRSDNSRNPCVFPRAV